MPNAQQAVWQKSGVRAKLKASSSYAANAVRIGFFCNLANGSQHIGYVRAKLKLFASIFRSFAKLLTRWWQC